MARLCHAQRNPKSKVTAALSSCRAASAWKVGAVGYQMPFLTEACLPRKRLWESSVSRLNGRRSYEIRSPSNVGLPFGTYPRLITYWMATQVKKGEGPRLDLGRNFTSFQRDLGIASCGGANGPWNAVLDQLKRLLVTTVTVTGGDLGSSDGWHSTVRALSSSSRLWSATSDQFANGEITLSLDLVDYLKRHASPIDMRAVHALRTSPLALDIYCWLTARVYRLNRPVFLRWSWLAQQFGMGGKGVTTERTLQDFRLNFLRIAGRVKAMWPDLHFTADKEFFVLHPSEPHVKRKRCGYLC